MLKIGLTGGIGSGKTIVSKVFEKLGVPVYRADAEAKKLMNTDEKLIKEIKKAFGEEMYNDDGIDRKAMADVVFNDEEKLQQLNSLVHPAVQRDFQNWAKKFESETYILKEAAILFESGSHNQADKIVVVTAPEELRIKRVMERDQVNRQDVLARMKNQWKEDKKVELADFVITNDGKQMIIPQVLEIHEKIRNL